MDAEGGNNGIPSDDGGTCCCGCSLRCAIISFGVMFIINFIMTIIVMCGMFAVIAAVKSGKSETFNTKWEAAKNSE